MLRADRGSRMKLELSADQAFFRETTARFLDEQVPVDELRRLREDAAGFDEKYWVRGADLGWTSLLIDEQHGGGSISGDGLADLALIAYEFGRHAAPGPLITTNVVAGAITESHPDLIAGVLSGAATASWAVSEPVPDDRLGRVTLDVHADGDDVVLSGVK